MTNLHFLLALSRMPGLSSRSILSILKRWPNLDDLFATPRSVLVKKRVPDPIALAISKFTLADIAAELTWAAAPNHTIIGITDARYPCLLKEIYDPPAILYAVGDLSCLQTPSVAMVGSRKPTATGRELAYDIAYKLGKAGVTVVSGLALGIDAAAHQGVLNANASTIAVLGTGVDNIYPNRHQALAAHISRKGLIISEMPLSTPPRAQHFPRRNRLISGLSLSTLVVEAAPRSGSLITARFALEQNRDVMAIPGSVFNMQSRGCHALLQAGARLVTSAEDVLSDLAGHPLYEPMAQSRKAPYKGKYSALFEHVGDELTTIDQIAVRSKIALGDVILGLSELELQGMIKAVPGGYMRCMHER